MGEAGMAPAEVVIEPVEPIPIRDLIPSDLKVGTVISTGEKCCCGSDLYGIARVGEPFQDYNVRVYPLVLNCQGYGLEFVKRFELRPGEY